MHINETGTRVVLASARFATLGKMIIACGKTFYWIVGVGDIGFTASCSSLLVNTAVSLMLTAASRTAIIRPVKRSLHQPSARDRGRVGCFEYCAA